MTVRLDSAPNLRLNSYDPEAFNKLPSISDAVAKFDAIDGDSLVSTSFRELFLRHNMDRTFGLILLHRHFELDQNERLVSYGDTSVPWQLSKISKNIMPSNWLLSGDGAIRPYEFCYTPAMDEATGPNLANSDQQAFFDALIELLHKHKAEGLWGLCRYPGDGFPGRVEITEGRANINLRPEDYPKDMESRTAAWFFSPPLWDQKCNCGCRHQKWPSFKYPGVLEGQQATLTILISSMASTMAPSIKGFHPENIPGIVSDLRLNGTMASFCFGTADRPLSGKQCLIYAVQFPDGATWAVRVPAQANHLPPGAVTAFVEMEVSILKRIETSGFSRSPRLLGYNSGFDNPVGFPYIVSTWVEGTPAEWSDSIPSDRDTRNKFLRQMADITLELADCTQEWRPTTAGTYLTDLIDRKIVRVSNGQLPGIQLRDCFIQRALVPRVVHFPLEMSPFLVSHEDLSPDNIIVDNEYNIKGIIDWGFATLLPLQFAVYFPRILAIEPSQIDAPQPPDVAAFSLAFFQPSAVLQADRRYFTSYLSSRRDSLARSISLVLSTSDVDWRHLVFEAASSKGLHKWVAQRSWLLHGSGNGLQDLSSITLAKEVVKFLAGTVGQKSNLTRERILDAIKIEDDDLQR
ncbi:hypothetical protein FGG08_003289 [Glutinoglossum americanum]|uniref:Protein kinase domain-containing protein n=1 Tax=Glutinoglossum americanum TaxID=1670608 RepID=A0A9P8IDM7_9PEZI|nr:hypothetical protein FGG08_003289 [Glutinoglossum americanum]